MNTIKLTSEQFTTAETADEARAALLKEGHTFFSGANITRLEPTNYYTVERNGVMLTPPSGVRMFDALRIARQMQIAIIQE